MAKPLGPKSLLIREAIKANPDLGNKEIAELLTGSEERKKDKIEVTSQDIAQQKQQMKKAGEATPAAAPKPNPGRPKAAPPASAAPPSTTPAAQASPVDVIDKAYTLAEECGGIEQLKRLVDRMAGMGR